MISTFLRRIDVFGAEVGIKYEGKSKYTSRFGGLSTLLVMGLLLALIYQQSIQIYMKDISNVIYQQQHVEIPSRYDLTPNKFSFMIGVFNSELQPIIDEQIYYLEAIFNKKQQIISPNGSIQSVIVSQNIIMGPCSSEDFQQIDVKEYFENQPYENLYCMKNQTDIYLEGQFDKDIYTQISIDIKECKDSNCKNPVERQNFLQSSQVQVYFTHRILELSNYENPFKAVGKTQYYNLFYDFFLLSDFIFSNTQILDDIGLFVNSEQSKKELLFYSDRQQLSQKTSNSVFQCAIYLQKDNEDMYKRNYKKIPEILSLLGGTFQVLFFFGCFIIKPYNQFRLQNRLYKDIFSEDNEKENKKQQFHQTVQIQNKLKKSEIKFNLQLDETQIHRKGDIIPIIKEQEEEKHKTINLSKINAVKLSLMRKIKNCPTYCFTKQSSSSSLIQKKKQQIEIFRSLKTIINTQIQFKRIQQLIFQNDQDILNLKCQSIRNDEISMNQKLVSENSLNLFNSTLKKQVSKETAVVQHVKSTFDDRMKVQANQCQSLQNIQNQSQSKQQNQLCSQQLSKNQNNTHLESNSSILKENTEKNDCMNQQNNQPFDKAYEDDNHQQSKGYKIRQDNSKNNLFDKHPNKILSFFDLDSNEPSIKYKNEDYLQMFRSINDKNQKQKLQRDILPPK